MIVYRTRVAEAYQGVLLVDDRGYRKVRAIIGAEPRLPVAGQWKAPWAWLQAEAYGKQLKYADLPWYSSELLGVNLRAREVLEPAVSEDAEFLPLECEDDELWLMRPLRSVLALDMEKAIVVLQPSGRIRSVTSYAFVEHEIRGLACFTDPRVSTLFVTEEVVAAAKNAGLVGTDFKAIWRSPAD